MRISQAEWQRRKTVTLNVLKSRQRLSLPSLATILGVRYRISAQNRVSASLLKLIEELEQEQAIKISRRDRRIDSIELELVGPLVTQQRRV